MQRLFFALVVVLLHGCSKLTDAQIQARENLTHAHASECMMDVFFTYNTNWQKIEGESGIHGIDGLYIKQKHDNISDVLVAESKYNTSRLGTTKKGRVKQMSKRWILDKLKEAKPYNPDIKNFEQIATLVQLDRYRARVFKVKPYKLQKLKITIYRIKNKTDTKIEKVDKSVITIETKEPQNPFHLAMLKAYKQCEKEGLERWFR